MNLVDTILISLATVAFVIGVHQSFYYGLAASYWVFMISLFIVMFIRYRRSKAKEKDKSQKENSKPLKSGKKNNKKL